jgi:multiple sugar transport system permease protein
MTRVAGRKTSFARQAARNFHQWLPGYLFVLPATIFLFALTIYPSLHLIGLSMTDWKLTNVPSFVGLNNFTAFAHQPSSGRILYVTVLFLVLDLVAVLAIGLPVALALNGK